MMKHSAIDSKWDCHACQYDREKGATAYGPVPNPLKHTCINQIQEHEQDGTNCPIDYFHNHAHPNL